jgi:hypothetical protein
MGTAIVTAALAIVSAFYVPSPLMSLVRAAATVVWSGV